MWSVFVNYTDSYYTDSVPLKNLWKTLEHYNISNSISRVIKRLYENSFSEFKIGKQLSSGFYVTKGLRQTCSLSPTLFKIYIQNALEERFSNFFQVGTTFISQNVLRTTLLLGLSNSLGLP